MPNEEQFQTCCMCGELSSSVDPDTEMCDDCLFSIAAHEEFKKSGRL